MDQRERMNAGLPYKAWLDGLEQDRLEAKKKTYAFNHLPPEDAEGSAAILRDLLGASGEGLWVEAPFRCDYGYNIRIGKNFYANYNLTILDVGLVTIGDNVMVAPNVSIFTAGHPIHPQARNSGYEYGLPVTIGDNVWIGGGAILLPGVIVGSNTVIGAGSVVGRDLPPNVVAAGNPCRVVREITAADRDFYFRDRRFDVDDYLAPKDFAAP